ncbi:MAG: FAD-dependent oxidoreductase, partial [Calditrichia bacterium]|nr:FAD-dependent oxidoreductase [Calditrichia bacterium]
KNKVEYINAEAKITGKNEATLNNGEKITGKNIIIGTGSRPIQIPGFEFDGEKILSSDHALMLEKLPKKAVILGAGAIGMEFSHIWNGFGVEVHLVELLDQILPAEDAEIAIVTERAFKKRGIKIYTGTKATKADKTDNGVLVTIEDKNGKTSELEADMLLVVVGRKPNTENIGLENVNISTERGFVPVKDYYETSTPGIYAIGDIVASPLLAHVASKEAEIAVEHIANHKTIAKIAPDTIPGAVYCEPQVASFGLNEKQCIENEIAYKKATFPYRGAGKSVAIGKSEGLVKVIYSPETKELLGCHIVGAEATELIHELLLAKTSELLPENIATMIHAHPTLSETLMEVMRAVEGWVIHA